MKQEYQYTGCKKPGYLITNGLDPALNKIFKSFTVSAVPNGILISIETSL